MDINDLQIGAKLELELRDEDGRRLDYSLVSQVEWMVDHRTMMIAAPIHEGILYPIRVGTMIDVYYMRKHETEYELYSFRASVTGREMNDNIALLRIVVTSRIERVQRRKYFRLDCSLPVKFRIVDSMNESVNESVQFRKTIARNLSGGGICLLLEDKLEVGKLVECEISTGGEKVVKFFGKIIRYQKREIEGKYRYEAGIAYIKISNNDREAVVKYIFNEQRKLRKKGLI